MDDEPDLIVSVSFTAAARAHLGLTQGPPLAGPPAFLDLAQHVQAGDFLRLEGVPGLFVVSHRVWHVMADQTTLKLILDGPVSDER